MVFPHERAIENILGKAQPEEITVVKRVSFDAAHYLPNYKGKCANMHGHHWVVELGVKGLIGESGMVIDFVLLKNFLEDEVVKVFDHKLINDIIPNPTAENICLWVKEAFRTWGWSVTKCKLDFIQVWETGDSYAEFKV